MSYITGTSKELENDKEQKGWQKFLTGLGNILSAIFTQQRNNNTPIYQNPQTTIQPQNNNSLQMLAVGAVLLVLTKTIK